LAACQLHQETVDVEDSMLVNDLAVAHLKPLDDKQAERSTGRRLAEKPTRVRAGHRGGANRVIAADQDVPGVQSHIGKARKPVRQHPLDRGTADNRAIRRTLQHDVFRVVHCQSRRIAILKRFLPA
jgi:hypothetical protein